MKQDLTALFNKFVGVEMKNPYRASCDMCDVAEEMQTIAMNNGVTLVFTFTDGSEADRPQFFGPNPVEILLAPQANGTCRVAGLKR